MNQIIYGKELKTKTIFSKKTNQYSDLVIELYKKNQEIIIIDMIKTLNLEKMLKMLEVCYDLKLLLVSAVSRPPAFKTKASSLLKSRYKIFTKPPEIRRLFNCIKELSKLSSQITLPELSLQKYGLYQDLNTIAERYKCNKLSTREKNVGYLV